MNLASLNKGMKDWWVSNGADGWATGALIGLLLGFYAVPFFVRGLLFLFLRQDKASRASTGSASRGHCIEHKSSASRGHCIELVNDVAPIVTETDLQRLLLLLDESGHLLPWTPVVDKQSETFSYHAKLREPEDGTPTEYLSTSIFHNCSCRDLKDFYMDSEYRLKWDKTFESYELLHADEKTGFEMGRFIRRFPFVRPREYVLAWRLWEGEDGSFYYFAKHCEHPRAPHVPAYTRIEHYMSGWCIQQEGNHCKIKMWHQEDTTSAAKMAFSYRIWSYMCDMEKNLRKFLPYIHHSGSQNTMSTIPKVPAAMVKLTAEMFQPSRQSDSIGAFRKKELLRRPSGKWMANGMLLLGGAMFFATRRSAPAGAKLAALYAIQKLVKPSSTQVRPIRQHYPVL